MSRHQLSTKGDAPKSILFSYWYRMGNHPTTVPHDLFAKVMSAIDTERARLQAIRRFIVASCICIGALVSSIFVCGSFFRELSASGFGQYLSLAFIDIRAVLANWEDFGMSLLESFPTINAVGLLCEVIILMLSTKFIVIYGKQYLIYGKQPAR